MNSRTKRITWRLGIPLVLVACLIGFLLGYAIDHVNAATPVRASAAKMCPPEMHCPPAPSGCTDCVRAYKHAKRAAHHFREGNLHRAPKRMHYSAHNKRVIIAELRQAQRRMAARGARGGFAARVARMDDAQLWALFVSHDTCVDYYYRTDSHVVPWASSCAPTGPYVFKNTPLTRGQVHAYLCGGAAGIAMVPAVTKGPWGIGAVLSGWVVCQWGSDIESRFPQ